MITSGILFPQLCLFFYLKMHILEMERWRSVKTSAREIETTPTSRRENVAIYTKELYMVRHTMSKAETVFRILQTPPPIKQWHQGRQDLFSE